MVDFPAPLGPTIAILSPACASNETPFRTEISLRAGYENVMSLKATSPFSRDAVERVSLKSMISGS